VWGQPFEPTGVQGLRMGLLAMDLLELGKLATLPHQWPAILPSLEGLGPIALLQFDRRVLHAAGAARAWIADCNSKGIDPTLVLEEAVNG